jgi:hypothetical protein
MNNKLTLTSLFLVVISTIFSQTSVKWYTFGIVASTYNFFSTTNSYPIDKSLSAKSKVHASGKLNLLLMIAE